MDRGEGKVGRIEVKEGEEWNRWMEKGEGQRGEGEEKYRGVCVGGEKEGERKREREKERNGYEKKRR